MKFQKFEPSKTLPAAIMDFVLRDSFNGIISPEFEKAVEGGDVKNISEGIDSIILNAEMKTRVRLNDKDRFMVHMVAQDEVIQKLFDEAEENLCS